MLQLDEQKKSIAALKDSSQDCTSALEALRSAQGALGTRLEEKISRQIDTIAASTAKLSEQTQADLKAAEARLQKIIGAASGKPLLLRMLQFTAAYILLLAC